jgi:hypothetical protein
LATSACTSIVVVPKYRETGSGDKPSLASQCIGGQKQFSNQLPQRKNIKCESSFYLKFIHSVIITSNKTSAALPFQKHLNCNDAEQIAFTCGAMSTAPVLVTEARHLLQDTL